MTEKQRLTWRILLTAGVLLTPIDLWADTKIVVLKNGDTLMGEIIDKTEDEVSIQLKTGVLIRLASSEIEAIENPHREQKPAEQVSVPEKSTSPVNLRTLFKKPNPTPTPLPLVPLDLRLNYTRRQSKDPSTLKPLPPILPTTTGNEDKQAKNPSGDIVEEFGKVVWTLGLSKYRHNRESWQPAQVGTTLYEGDEISTLSGRMEVHSRRGAVIRLHPSTDARFGEHQIAVDRGKGWVRWKGEGTFPIHFGGVEAAIEDAVARVEYLRTGLKFVLLEGKATLYKRPEGEIIRGDLSGPVTLLLDESRDVISRGKVDENLSSEWEEWEKVTISAGPAGSGSIAGSSPIGTTPTEQARLLQNEQLRLLKEAVERFYLDLGRFPDEKRPFFQDLVSNPGSEDWHGPYLKGMNPPLVDPWGTELLYRLKTDPVSGEVTAGIYSLGPNKTFEEGEGDDLGVLVNRPGR